MTLSWMNEAFYTVEYFRQKNKTKQQQKNKPFSLLNMPSHTNWARFLNGFSCCVMKSFSSSFLIVRMFASTSETQRCCC